MLVTEDWYFVSHRLEFARKLVEEGYRVAIGCRCSGEEGRIRAAGIEVFDLPFARQSLSLTHIVADIVATRSLISDVAPDLVHNVALRPILIAWLASFGLRHVPTINAITGLGSLFTGQHGSMRLRLVRAFVTLLLRPIFRSAYASNVFQNQEDFDSFVARGFSRSENSVLIRGAGVDPAGWIPRLEPESGRPVVLFVGRLLEEKGLRDLVKASQILSARGVAHTIRVIGAPDDCNPKSLSAGEIDTWVRQGSIEWLGRRLDVLEQMSSATVIALPSYYREGLPKVLLEAGLAARAAVTCDVVGCREIVAHEVTGLLVPPRDPLALANAIGRLLADSELRRALGSALRARVTNEFSLQRVTGQFLGLYADLLAQSRKSSRKPAGS